MTDQVSGIPCTLYFRWENKYLQPARSQIYAWLHTFGKKTCIYNRYLRLAKSQIYLAIHILIGKLSTYNRSSPRYTLNFIYLVGKHVPATD